MIDYIKDSILLKDNIIEHNIYINKINGYIYRGDFHKNSNLVDIPKFFGTFESSTLYINNNYYLKKYKTKGIINILNTVPENQNIDKILNFFRNDLIKLVKNKYNNIPEEYLIFKIKITIILLQIFFGFIKDKYSNLSLENLHPNQIINHFKKNKFNSINLKLLYQLLTYYNKNNDITPSRIGVRIFDQFLMKNLKFLLEPIDIQGIFYVKYKKYNSNDICNIINTKFKINSCIPTEICIFDPKKNLNYIQLQHKVNKKFQVEEIIL